MKEILFKSMVLLLLSIFLLTPFWNTAECDERSSMIYGSACEALQDSYETELCEDACDQIEYYFNQVPEYYAVGNYYGVEHAAVTSHIPYYDTESDFATVFYKGHTFFYPDMIMGMHYFVYDHDAAMWPGNPYWAPFLWDFEAYGCQQAGTHKFVFFWSCDVCNEIGYLEPGQRGFPACWLMTTDPGNGKCFMGFVYVSKAFEEETGYGNYGYNDFATSFYDYATQGYTVYESLYQAALDTLGTMNHELFTGYYIYMYDQYWLSYLTWYGDSGITLT